MSMIYLIIGKAVVWTILLTVAFIMAMVYAYRAVKLIHWCNCESALDQYRLAKRNAYTWTNFRFAYRAALIGGVFNHKNGATYQIR